MYRLLALCALLTMHGCGDPSASAPRLTVEIERPDGKSHSIGSYRVFSTGVLSESGDHDEEGKGQSQRLAVDDISEEGITLTFEVTESSGERTIEQLFVQYGRKSEVKLASDSTLIVQLESLNED